MFDQNNLGDTMYTTQANPKITDDDRRIVMGIAPIVEKQLELMGQVEYQDKFVIERYLETHWYIRPKSSMFSRETGHFGLIEFNKNHNNFPNGTYFLIVSFHDHPKGRSPGDQRIKELCKVLTEATGLNIHGFRNSHELFWGKTAH
jgi:hypothetical protein